MLATAPRAGQLGRPAINGSRVVFAQTRRGGSAIELADLAAGTRTPLRVSRRGVALSNPSLLAGRLLYERVTRCAQQLRLAGLRGGRRERILLDLPSTAPPRSGLPAGLRTCVELRQPCPGGRTGGGSLRRLGPTALGPRSAFVTVIGAPRASRACSRCVAERAAAALRRRSTRPRG